MFVIGFDQKVFLFAKTRNFLIFVPKNLIKTKTLHVRFLQKCPVSADLILRQNWDNFDETIQFCFRFLKKQTNKKTVVRKYTLHRHLTGIGPWAEIKS